MMPQESRDPIRAKMVDFLITRSHGGETPVTENDLVLAGFQPAHIIAHLEPARAIAQTRLTLNIRAV